MSTPLEVLGFYKTVFKFFGAYEIDSDSKVLRRLQILYTIGYQLIFTDLGCILFAMSLLKSTSSKETLQILFVVFAYINAVVKAIIFFTNRKQLKTLWLKLSDPDFIARNQMERSFVDDAKFHITKEINNYSCFVIFTLILITIAPVLMWERRLPYFMYVPFGIDQTNFGFGFLYAYQIGNEIYAGGLNIAVNMYLFGMFVCITYFLSLLSSRVSRLGHENGYNRGRIKTPILRMSFYRDMCDIIEFHLKIDAIVRKTNELSNDLIFVQVCQAAFVLANSAFLLMAFDLTVIEYIVPIFWLSSFLAEMTIYCYYGHNIMYAFDQIHHNIFCNNFIAFDKKTIDAMLKMMTVTGSRQMKIVSVGLVRFEMSLETLLKILKTTYSIVMLFNSM